MTTVRALLIFLNAKKALKGIILYTYKSNTRERTGRTRIRISSRTWAKAIDAYRLVH